MADDGEPDEWTNHCDRIHPECPNKPSLVRGRDLARRFIDLQKEVERLEKENQELREKLEPKGGQTERTWYDMAGQLEWRKYHKLICKEENMSTVQYRIHPELCLVPASRTSQSASNLQAQRGVATRPFNFDGLPVEVQSRVFRAMMHHPDQLVHAVSRFSPFAPPENSFPPEKDPWRSGIPRWFIIGSGIQCVNLNDKDLLKPVDVLSPLLTCRRWYFILTHAFYGLNTFAFSSLGELARFFKGIGQARADRIQHVEITLQGSQKIVSERYIEQEEGRQGKLQTRYYSKRTIGLSHLSDAKRLKTLVVHLDETHDMYIRRRHEPTPVKQYGAFKTAGQPNNRKLRDLRTIQGMDSIRALRGMAFVRFYQSPTAKQLPHGRERKPVHDYSFTEEVTGRSCKPKVLSRQAEWELRRLSSRLFPSGARGNHVNGWEATDVDWNIVAGFYDDDYDAYDDFRQRRDAEPDYGQEDGDDNNSDADSSSSESTMGSSDWPDTSGGWHTDDSGGDGGDPMIIDLCDDSDDDEAMDVDVDLDENGIFVPQSSSLTLQTRASAQSDASSGIFVPQRSSSILSEQVGSATSEHMECAQIDLTGEDSDDEEQSEAWANPS